MSFFLQFPFAPLPHKIGYARKIMMAGSCFSTEIGDRLAALKFDVYQNPTGIVYHPLVIAEVLDRCILRKPFYEENLFEHNGLWNSWLHHSSFSGSDKSSMATQMNTQIEVAHGFLRDCDFLFLTPATAFGYYLTATGQLVANCHKMPSVLFEKRLSGSGEMADGLSAMVEKIKSFNPRITIVFTVSPVRHYRDGIIENTISKAHVVTAVHTTINRFKNVHYFPSYEIMIDELRDYRFFKNDFAHPNETAISYIFRKFVDFALEEEAKDLMKKIEEIITATRHRPRFPLSKENQSFAERQLQKIHGILSEYPFLDFEKEIGHFHV